MRYGLLALFLVLAFVAGSIAYFLGKPNSGPDRPVGLSRGEAIRLADTKARLFASHYFRFKSLQPYYDWKYGRYWRVRVANQFFDIPDMCFNVFRNEQGKAANGKHLTECHKSVTIADE